jgi:peroxiredoxin
MRYKILVLNVILLLSLMSLSHANSMNTMASLNVGDKAPDFVITNPEGKSINLYSLKGKVILLDFWASWCQPCRMANIEIVPLYQKFNPLGFEIFSVSMDSKKEHWINAIKSDNLSWPNHGSELKGFEQSKVAELYGVDVLPGTFLIDEEGVIIDKDFDDYDLEMKLQSIFFEQVNFYPLEPDTKLFFTNDTKYQIENLAGKVLLKGKGVEADVSALPVGSYLLRYEKKQGNFTKRKASDVPATFYPLRAEDALTISRKVSYEIYNQRGKLERKGNGAEVDVSFLKPGLYYISLDGLVSTFHKK